MKRKKKLKDGVMAETVKLACSCGEVEGEVKIVKKESFHVKCLCCDCQQFAAHLGQENRILDDHGGTELFQTYPAYFRITKGMENIASVRLTEKGLLRHHTTCCNTPTGNMMMNPKVPFVGIPVAFMQFDSEKEKDRILGPLIMEAFGKYARNGKPDHVHERFPLSFMPKILKFMAKGYFVKKYLPSPYFSDGKSVTHPKIVG